MQELTMNDTEMVGGSGAFLNYVVSSIIEWSIREALAGNVDYAGMAEQQGHYYNMVGA